jgi:hypothetical protein
MREIAFHESFISGEEVEVQLNDFDDADDETGAE